MRDQKISDKVLLQSILDRIARIEQHNLSDFSSETVFDAIVFNLITIGEGVNKLSLSFKEKYPEIPWGRIVAQRNVLIHNYLGINEKTVRNVVETYLPPLKKQIEAILKG